MSTWKKILHTSIIKIIVGFIAIGLTIGITELILVPFLAFNKDINHLIIAVITAVMVLLAYVYLYRFYENRKVIEVNGKGVFKSLLSGILLGGLLQSLTIFIMYLNGYFSIVSINSLIFILPALTMAFSSAITEEVLFRGILFRLVEEKLGSYLALLISGLIFGLMHYSNPNSSLDAALGLAIQAGLLLGAAYIYSRNLWFPIAVHFAWNFTQSGIFGASTSGLSFGKSLLTTTIEGSELITGGQFGPEGSIQATLFCLAATIVLMVLSHKNNRIISPFWKR